MFRAMAAPKKKPVRAEPPVLMVKLDPETRALFTRAAEHAAEARGVERLGVSTWLRMVGRKAAIEELGADAPKRSRR